LPTILLVGRPGQGREHGRVVLQPIPRRLGQHHGHPCRRLGQGAYRILCVRLPGLLFAA